MDRSVTQILEKIRPLVSTLTPEERLELIEAIASLEPTSARQAALTEEQAAWFARPRSERQGYPGEYIAVRAGRVVDHDQDRRALTLRVRAQYGPGRTLILHSDWDEPLLLYFNSTRFEQR